MLLPGIAPAGAAGTTAIGAAIAAGAVAAIATGLAGATSLPRSLQAGVLTACTAAPARDRADTLLVLQTALSVVRLAGAGLFGRSLLNLLSQDFGIRMDGVFVVDFEEGAGMGELGGQDPFGSALDRVRALPEVRGATVIQSIPFAGHNVPPIAVPGRVGRRTSADSCTRHPAGRGGSRTDLPFVRVRPYAQLLDRQLRPWHLGSTLFAWFSGLALAVGAMGLYAAFAHTVAERWREMAICHAIGTRPARVMTMVLRESLTVAAAGIVFGCLGALAGGRALRLYCSGRRARIQPSSRAQPR